MDFKDLAGLPEPERIRRLADLLEDGNWLNRKTAADQLAALGAPAVAALARRLVDGPTGEDFDYWAVQVIARAGAAGLEPLLAVYARRCGDPAILAVLVRALRFEDERVIDLLIQELGHERWTLRQEAARSLLRIGRPAVAKLKQAFNHGNKDVRFWTVKIIGQILGEQAIEAFLKLLQSNNDDLRYYAVTALGEIPAAATIAPLIQAFADRSWLVRSQAADILEKKGEPAVEPLVAAFTRGDADTRYWSLRTLTRILKGGAIERLRDCLAGDDGATVNGTDLKFHFIASLQEIGDRNAVDLLIRWLDEPTWLIRKTACDALVKIGPAAIAPIAEALGRSGSENVRYWCVRVLSQLGEAGLAPLLALLARSDRKEKLFIVQALQAIESDRVIRPLLALLEDEVWPVRSAAADALGEIRPDLLVGVLAGGFDDRSENVRYWLRNVLREGGGAVIDAVMRRIEGNLEEKAPLWRLLSFVATETAAERILRALREGTLAQREELVTALADSGDEAFAKILLTRLETVPSELAFWLSRLVIATRRVTADLVLREISGASSDKLVWLAKIMGELKDRSFIDPLVRMLGNPDRNVRYEATKILARFGGDDLTPVLLDRFIGEDEPGRLAIMENLKGIEREDLLVALVARFEAASEKDAYWIAKLLAEIAQGRKDLFVRLEGEAPKGSKRAYWIKRILEHLDGRSYL